MSKEQDRFFENKKPWSEIKDNILGEYLLPYTAKVLSTNKPIHYIDCFAGKGMFDDGNYGSPIIALNAFQEALQRTKAVQPEIETYFIEKEYSQDLKKNLIGRNYTRVIDGSYEHNIDSLLQTFSNDNVFLYLDPYGIKYLNIYRFFDLKNSGFSSIECLINFNSFGFFRVACSILGVSYLEGDTDDPDDYDLYYYFKENATEKLLNNIAGGDYWKEIIIKYKDRSITGFEAENQISEMYCQTLHVHYPFVIAFPIRLKEDQPTKYRLIHLTAHPKGCLLMAETLCNQEKVLELLQSHGQLPLLDECFHTNKFELSKSKRLLLGQITNLVDKVSIDIILADFYTSYGLQCDPKTLRNFVREFENQRLIRVIRDPDVTPTGKPKTSLSVSNNSKVWLCKK